MTDIRGASTPASDIRLVRRAGRIVALQTSAALAVVLVLVGAAAVMVYVREQENQITSELSIVAMNADDAGDPPPDMELALSDADGAITTSDGGSAGVPLLSGPTGFTDVRFQGREYRALVADRPEGGRVVALMDLAPYRASRVGLLGALALAELIGILASIAVVALFTRRSVRPLAQALALQRRFVADASHELRAPLTVLHTRAQLMAKRMHAGDIDAATRDADSIVSDTRGLSAIVDDLLASATMTAASGAGVRIDLAELCRSACEGMTPYAESLGVGVVCTSSGPEGSGVFDVIGSEAALRRAVTALVDNALGHETVGGTVRVDVRRDGQQVILSVVDDGVGIDQAAMATIFNRFSRGTAHTSRPGRESYGIGLSLVREIVEAHDGRITVTSAPGAGATFAIALPTAP